MFKHWQKAILFITIILVLLEICLRLAGYMPGYYFPKSFYEKARFKRVDTLVPLKVFYPDSEGIIRINQNECGAFNDGNPVSNRYYDYICNAHLNKDGFRSREFSDTFSNGGQKKRVFMLGASYTYGFSARPITNSFADVLAHDSNILVYNGGVPGCDAATYLAIAKKYLTIVRPDYLIVNFCLHNDEVYYNKKLKPFQFSDIFITNAGSFRLLNFETLKDDSVEVFDSPMDAYKNVLMKSSLACSDNTFARLASHLCVTTMAWKLLGLNQHINIHSTRHKKENYTLVILKQIKDAAEKVNAKLIISFIPPRDDRDLNVVRNYIGSITEHQLDYHLIDSLQVDDYAPSPDSHFNNKGHAKYGHYLQQLILSGGSISTTR